MGTREEILAKLEKIAAQLEALEAENARFRARVSELETELEKAQWEGKQQAARFRKPQDQKKPTKDTRNQ